MRVCRSVLFSLLCAVLLWSAPNLHARVMLTGMVNQFMFNIMPTAYFTVDDWLTNPNMWSVVISNSSEGNLTVSSLTMHFTISSSQFPVIAEGDIRVVGTTKALRNRLLPGETLVVNNTMVQEGKNFVTAGKWDDKFVDEVLRVGYLPEGQYRMIFVLNGQYNDGSSFSGSADDLLK